MTDRTRGRSLTGLATELLIVFVGVVLALAAENLREERAARVDARQSLELMLDELAGDSAAFLGQARDLELKAAGFAWIVENRDREAVPADSVAEILYRLFNVQTRITMNASAWETLETAGRLQLVEPDSLRRAILDYYQGRQERTYYWRETMDSLFEDRVMPSLWTHVRLESGGAPGSMWPPATTRLPLVSTWREFQNDRVLQNDIVMMGRIVEFAATYIRGSSDAATDLMRMIRSELRD